MFRFFRKTLILIHRYLGIALCLPFVVWFVSGIAMIYARGMPTLTPEDRMARLPELESQAVLISPSDAMARAARTWTPVQAMLLTILDRPAYRFTGGRPVTVFADNGEILEMNAERAAEAARLFMDLPADRLTAAGVLTSPDQWTIGQTRYMPLHKFSVDDDARTQLYVSEVLGEVVVLTTRGSRALAWVAAIPHWFYFKALRTKPQIWRQVVLWTAGLGTVSALIGLVLGVIQYRRARPHIPYSGWMRRHYQTGIIFGIFTVTWVFSGFLSMEPGYWASDGEMGAGMREAMSGGPLNLPRFQVPMPANLSAREVDYVTIQGEPYYRLRKTSSDPVLVSAETMQVRNELFSTESLLERLRAPNPGIEIVESRMLDDYDAYYYSADRRAPLPVLRVKFGDPESTWFYVDPRMSEIVSRAHRRERLQRWIYRGFHSLDFSFWYYNRPLWDVGVIGLSLGGIALSLIGVVIAWKRVVRAAVRR